MKKFFEEVSDSMGSELISGLAIALCVIMLFSVGFISGGFSVPAPKKETEPVASVGATTPTVPATEPTTAAPVTSPTQAPTSSSDSSSSEPTTAPSQQNGSQSMSTAEIVKLYNESANKVKTNAVKVIKNYEDREMNEETLVVP